MGKHPQNANRLIISKRMALYLVICLGAIWVAYLYRSALSSLILGALLAYLLIPAAQFLAARLTFSYRTASGVVFLIALGGLIIAIRYLAPILAQQIDTLSNDLQRISEELVRLQPALENLFNTSIPMDEIIAELESEASRILVPKRLFLILRAATANIVWIMVTVMTCFYLLLDHERFINWLHVIAPESLRGSLSEMFIEINQAWKTYLRGQLLMMLLIGILSGVGGMALGLRNALMIGLLAGLLEMIPSLGPTLSTMIAGVTAWTQGSAYLEISNFGFALLICGIFISIQALENTILLPRIMGRRMGLHPALVFIATITTLSLFGVIAGLIVIPVIASLGIIINYSFAQLNQPPQPGQQN